jgi:BON domain
MSFKMHLAVGLIASALLVAALPMRAQQNDQSAVDDQTIVNNINAKLFEDSALKMQDIRVSCQGGVVSLRGSVATELEKAAVDRIASTEPGVQKVVDSLAISGTEPAASAKAPDAPPKPAGLTVPAGTVVTVRLIDSIDSGRNQPGQEFDATVDMPVASGDKVAIPKDSTAKVRLIQAKNSGKMTGSAELELELASITVNGTPYEVRSGYYQQHGSSRGKRTAAATGGGAVLGALIGAIAGGGKGAAIGAGAGAATGAGVQAITKGSSVKVPSETKIDFTLKQPLTVSAGA